MSDIRNVRNSAKARRSRIIKLAPMTRAVRSALAASAMVLALGASGGALAATAHQAPHAQALKLERAAMDFAPVHDLTAVSSGVTEEVPEELYPTAISVADLGDVVIDNGDPISESDFKYGATAISGYSVYGNVDITNHAGADLYAYSGFGNAIGIYGYSIEGDVAIDNAASIYANSFLGVADGIFASGANVDVANSGAIETVSAYGWTAGIEAQGADSVSVDNSGDITATAGGFEQVQDYYGVIGYSAGAHAFGIYATGGEAGAVVENSGDITVSGGYTTGIEVQSGGDVSVVNSGDISSGSGLGYYYDAGTGYTYFYGTQVAIGINAGSNGEGAVVSVENSGDIVADGIFGGTGIQAVASGLGGAVSVTNTGDIYASQDNSSGYGAFGIMASADGDASIDNGGDIIAMSGGSAMGLSALSFAGNASVTNSGDVLAVSDSTKYYGAYGIVAFAGYGEAEVDNSGSVTAYNGGILAAPARAIDAQGLYGATVNNSGSLYANGKYAYGVFASSGQGDVSVTNEEGGEIGFYSYLGYGTGVIGLATNGNVGIDNAGDIEGYGYKQAVGVFGRSDYGDVSVDNSGSISVTSGSGTAAAVFARADYGTASVTNSGDITASNTPGTGFYGYAAYGILARGNYAEVANSGNIVADGYYYATGIAASSYYGTTVTNTGGSISAIAVGGGTGISASSLFGDASVDNASDIDAVGIVFGARGIEATSVLGDASIENSGDVYAGSLYGDSIGLYAYSSYGDASVDNSGDVIAISYYGLADGIFASGSDVEVTNSGYIGVYGYTWAAGIEAQGANGTSVDNSGDITVIAPGFLQVQDYYGVVGYSPGVQAFGIYATGGEGGVELSNSGTISVNGGYTTGIEVQSGGDVTVVNSGDIHSGSGYNAAYNPDNGYYYFYGTQLATGINVGSNGEGASVTVDNSGDITAEGIFGANGIVATASGYGGTVDVTNSGAIYASQNQKYGAGASGITASGDSDTSIGNSGAIDVYSGGVANGLQALSFAGDASVTNSGDVSVENTSLLYYAASGIVSFAGYGDAHVANSGSVDATSSYWATGIDARGFGDATVQNSGSVYANGQKYAFGVYATAGNGDVTVTNTGTGDIGFYSYLGRGWGVFGHATNGDVHVTNAGSIEGYAYGQSAGIFGVASQGDVGIGNSGDISVVSGGNVAVGVFARADYGTATVVNSGDIVASDFPGTGFYGYSAYGVLARGAYAAVSNSGSVLADGNYYATGIAARSYYGTNVVATATSEIEASALLVAIGIEARSEYGNVAVTNAGDVTVEGVYGGGVGIQAYSGLGNVTAANSGHVLAGSTYGTAIGVTGYSVLGNSNVSNSGTIDAAGYYGAYGIVSQSEFGSATAGNTSTGHIHAEAPSHAYGMFVRAYGAVTVNNAGSVSASADAGGIAAAVLMESLHGSSTLNNASTGVIGVTGTDGYAFAVIGSDAVDTINNSGKINGAISLLGGNDAFNNNATGVWDVGTTHATDFGAGNDTLTNAGTVRIGTGGLVSFGDGNDTINNGGLVDLLGGISMGAGNDTINNGSLFRINNGTVTMGAGTNAFNNTNTIKVMGAAGSIDLGGGTLTNSALIDFVDGATDDKLTIAGTLAGTGRLNIDFNLLTSTADQLQVNGNVAANAVQTVNVQFPGMPVTAHTSAVFARVTGTSVAGNFVAGQMIGYNEPANFLDLDLNVTSQINTANTAADVFSINVDVVGLNDRGTLAASVASGAASFLNTQVGTFRQRLGVNPYGDAGKVMSAFFRAYTAEGDVDPTHAAANFGQGGNFAYDQSTWGRELGVNANLWGNVHAGVVLGTADSRQRLTGSGVGQNRLDGMTWGAYATWYVPGGFYVDLTGRWMAMDVRSISAAGTLQSRVHTKAYSLEAGYEWNVGGFNIVPQLQYTVTDVEDVRTFFGDRANFVSHGGNFDRGRLGVEFNKTFLAGEVRITPYGSINAVREFDGESTYTVADNFFGSTSVEGTSTMAELGIGVQSGGWGFNLGANWTDGGVYDGIVGGQASIRFAW